MDYQQLISSMTPDIYERLMRAVELGKWPDGKKLTAEQRANAMQALIAWGEQHLPANERVGYVEPKQPAAEPCEHTTETPLRWKH